MSLRNWYRQEGDLTWGIVLYSISMADPVISLAMSESGGRRERIVSPAENYRHCELGAQHDISQDAHSALPIVDRLGIDGGVQEGSLHEEKYRSVL